MTTTGQRVVPAHVVTNPRLGTWLRVVDGIVEVHVGKVELGQGILTALAQVAADALDLSVAAVRVRHADTHDGPDQGLTAGSLSLTQSTPALRHVGSVARAAAGPTRPVGEYVERLAVLDPATDLTTAPVAPLLAATHVGRSEPRVDLPDKVLGRPRYLADLRPPGLLHGRVLRPPSPGAVLREVDEPVVNRGGDDVQLVRDGSFVGVVAGREDDADRAIERLAAACTWEEHDALPDEDDLPAWLRAGPHETVEVLDEPAPDHGADGGVTLTASYSKPFLAHASLAPSAGLARWDPDELYVWSHSQGIHPLRDAIAAALGRSPASVRVQHAENAGCYGHNGADDAAFDAVLLARAVPGRPVLVRWSRADELAWSPLSPAMTATISARLVGGRITSWTHDVWGQGHSSRPGYRGVPGLLGAVHLATPLPAPVPTDPPAAAGWGTTRNAVPAYDVGPRRVTGHRLAATPLRSSAMRALGAYLNVFAIESFLDEVAEAAGTDPVDLRLEHLRDPRAVAVVETAARLSGWRDPVGEDGGRGLGFARYKDTGAWCAVVAEVAVDTEVRLHRLVVVADIGTVVNPDGARNQLEGGATQAASWTLRERVRFDRRRITSTDWERYPVLRFTDAPQVEVHLVDSDQPPLGAGEAAQGPTAAAIANAVHRALGVRVRDLPLDAAAVVRAIEEQG